MVIAIDIDEVIYPFADGAVEYVGKMGLPVTGRELYGDQEVTASGLNSTDFREHVQNYQFEDISLEPGPIEGTTKALKELEENHELYLVTSRNPKLEDMTMRWINIYLPDIQFADVIFVGNHFTGSEVSTKLEACGRIGAHFLIDDQPRYVDLLKDHSTEAILFGNYHWNEEHQGDHFVRASDWSQVLKIIDERDGRD